MTASVRLEDVTAGYDRHPAVHHLTGQFEAGSLHAVVGPNGAGKSTLLKTIMGLIVPDAGSVSLAGLRQDEIAYLPQQADLDRTFPISVADVVLLGAWRRAGAFGSMAGRDRLAAEAALDSVGLEGFGGRSVGSLSVGQLQRVLFARIILQDCPLILLDEPFAGIDAPTVTDLMGVINRWHGEGRTVVAVLHDLELVRACFPRTLLLARSGVAWGETRAVLRQDNLLRAWGMPQGWDAQAAPCRVARSA
ncbi:MAG: metal ABC transporter ATP-binding protein [Geminicoccaceae bacterium]